MRPDTKVFRQLPLYTNWRSTDSIDTLREIMQEHEQGCFLNSSTFWEECLTDDRIGAVFDTRLGGLTGADLSFVAANDKRKSTNLANALGGSDKTADDGLWLRMVDSMTAEEILKWKLGIGVAFGKIDWDTSNGQWVPKVTCWHPRFLRWDWAYWGYVVTSWGEPIVYLPKPDENIRCDGKWFVWGGYRSWMTGLVRSLGVPYIDRGWNQRDAARYSEKYGMGIIEGKTPAGASEPEKRAFENRLRGLGNEPTIVNPQGRTKDEPGWGIELHQVGGEGWQIFKGREDQLNSNIAIRVLGQNLTTEVQGGSLAASKVHERVRGDVKRRDAEFFRVIREQVLTWWAQYTTGDPELAPYPRPSFDAPEDPLADAQELLTIVTAIEKAPPELDTQAILETHGLPVREGDALAAAIERFRALQPQQAGGTGSVLITPSASASAAVTKVNEVRAQQGLEPLVVDGDLTVAEYMAKHSSIISRATNAESGQAESQGGAVDLRAVSQLSEAVSLRSPTGANRRRAKYQDAQSKIAARAASKTLRPFIQRVLQIVGSPDGEEDRGAWFQRLRREIVAEGQRRGVDVEGLAKLTEQVNILARLHGREESLNKVLG